ncbi:carbohydrate sulfotransferase 11-like [Cherax quadricarinatus]|uniref:carbohydrate sulfotransferase 11-like n=1 Tax=Cherax quadricarinatus TaxID=27406 RepID=UPI00387E62EB
MASSRSGIDSKVSLLADDVNLMMRMQVDEDQDVYIGGETLQEDLQTRDELKAYITTNTGVLTLPHSPRNTIITAKYVTSTDHQHWTNIIVDEKFIEEREEVYKKRTARVKQVCDKLAGRVSYGSVTAAPLHRLRWLTSHKMIMCFNAKVGTTTWTKYMMEAAFPGHLNNASNWHYTAQALLKPPFRRASNKALALMGKFDKVMLVRHPFARLVSAYIDKVATGKFANLCRHIVNKYRPDNSPLTTRQPSFKEFVQYLVETIPARGVIRNKKAYITDRHWRHYYANCAVCDIHYNVIGTMETMTEDTRYMVHKYRLGVSDHLWMNHLSTTSEEAALRLFQTVPETLTMKLYQRYQVDFLMFGYDVQPYLPSLPHSPS